jgi:hypothetical protein
MMKIENDEERWRAALEAKGVEWVTAKLRERPGRPNDVLLDIVFEGSQPTRFFCQSWCAEQDNRLFRLTPYGIAMWVAVVVLFAFMIKGYIAWEAQPAQPVMADSVGDVAPAPVSSTDISTLMASPTVPVGSSSSFSSSSSSSSSSDRVSQPSATGLCSYTTYDTDRCGSTRP